MKKLVLMMFLSVFVVSATFAQKKNVKKAYKISEAYENPDFYEAETWIEPALTDETTKDDPYTWWVAGHIHDRKIAYENDKVQLGQSPDEEIKQEAAFKAYDYFIKALDLEKLPNAKGKISNKYSKKIAATLAWYYRTFLIFNYGLVQAEYEDYNLTVEALDKHLSIVDLPCMELYKGSKEVPRPQKDSTYYKIKYYSAIYESLAGNKDNSIAKFEAIKHNGFKESEIYQYLYNLYLEKKDSVQMMRILADGAERFPEDVVFLGLNINILLEKGQKQEALERLNKVIERNPNNPEYYNIRGQVNRDLNNDEDAIRDYDKAISMSPKNPIFLFNKAEFLYYEAMDFDVIANNSSNKARATEYKDKANNGFTNAKAQFKKVLEADENNLPALRYLRNIAVREEDNATYKVYDEKIKSLE